MFATVQSHSIKERLALEIFQRHVTAFFSGNLDAVLDDFGEHSVVFTPDGVFEGLAQIRKVYQGLLDEFGVIDRGDSPGIVIDTLLVREDAIFITWHAQSKHLVFPFGTDTFFCDGHTFTCQSIAFAPPRPKKDSASGG